MTVYLPEAEHTDINALASWRRNTLFRRTKTCLEEAAKSFECPDILTASIHFNLKGTTAGRASWGPMQQNGRPAWYKLSYTEETLYRADVFDETYIDTVPHEVAHIVVTSLKLTPGHSDEWRAIAIQLGSTGETYHTMTLRPAARKPQYLYRTQTGTTVYLPATAHAKIQLGKALHWKRTDEYVRSHDFIKEVPWNHQHLSLLASTT